MHPIFFEFSIPEFLHGILPPTITIYSYGFFIALGAILGSTYTYYEAKKQFQAKIETIQMLIVLIIIASIIGGKLFIIFENPGLYLSEPMLLLNEFRNGFVFYGSLILAIPTMLIFFKLNNLPVLPMLDIMAATTCIVHGFGRIGCFMAGCCYGTVHDGLFAVSFTDPACMAEPLNTPLHPTQLYSSITIFMILAVILFIGRRKQFNGQLFMIYLMLYAVARSVLEVFRGDLQRGFLIDNVLSNSQFISALIFITGLLFYIRLFRASRKVS